MTRKRFIKLLMSYGIQRNAAQKIAARYNSAKIPYEKAIKGCRLSVKIYANIYHFAAAIKETLNKVNALAKQTKGGAAE